MLLALLLLPIFALQDKPGKVDLDNTKLLVFDSSKGITLRIQNDGKVELSVRETDKESGKTSLKSYSASSAEAFREQYPDLVKKYELGRHLGGAPKTGMTSEEFDEWWKKLQRGMPNLPPFPGLEQAPLDEELQKLLEDQRELFKLRRPFRGPGFDPAPRETPPRQTPLPGGRELGLKVETVSETLRDQLSLKENEGVIVTEVKPGSVAARAGFKEHDLLLKLEGKPIVDRWQFRADVLASLGKPEFDVELLRAGKRETIKVRTAAKKDE